MWYDGYKYSNFMDSIVKIAEVTPGFKYDINSLHLVYSKSLNQWFNDDDRQKMKELFEEDNLAWTTEKEDKEALVNSYSLDMYEFRIKHNIFPFGSNYLNKGSGDMNEVYDSLILISNCCA